MAIIKCTKCGKVLQGDYPICPYCRAPRATQTSWEAQKSAAVVQEASKAPFRTWKLVSGILSIVLFLVVSLQSCAVGIGNALLSNGEVSGSAGFVVSVMLLAGGITSIATRNGGTGGNIALIVLFGLGALFGFVLAGSYSDLIIWAFWCLINVVFAIIALAKL